MHNHTRVDEAVTPCSLTRSLIHLLTCEQSNYICV